MLVGGCLIAVPRSYPISAIHYRGETKVTLSDKLLNTQEAAKYLRVSAASIRRWSDTSLLPARRVGRRRERRFRESDLQQFLSGGSSPLPGSTAALPGEVTVGGQPVPIYSHLSSFYNTDEGRLRLPIPFFCDGLQAGHKCFLVASGEALDAYLEALELEDGIDLETARKSGDLVVITGLGTTVERALAFWERSFTKALANGPTLIRVAGEMASQREIFASTAEMLRYESAYNTMAKRYPNVTLCQYDVRAFDGGTVYEALRAHPDQYALRMGALFS
ncbi:MAG TPA: MEDS domain-containing protein [Candidatus Dormibacteraeota bacterium]|nr:MEDS domain-containing protein [Candidatus Dormibacteraeota bacterium]